MIFVNDAAGQTIYTGYEWSALTGQAVEDSLGRAWLERVHPDDRGIVEDTHCRAVETVSEYSIRYRLLKPDDTVRWVSVGARPSFGPPGYAFLGFLGALSVLTEGATDAMTAYGNVALYVPPPASQPPSSDQLDQIADHMLLATALIEEACLTPALPGIRHSLYQIGRAIARRNRRRQTSN